MRDWRARLEHWVRVHAQLPELTQDCFPIAPACGDSWPSNVVDCPELADFYTRCDGGTFGAYVVSPLAELSDPSDGWLADTPGLELKRGRWLAFGEHEYGHTILWNADADEMLLYSPDDEEPRRLGRTIAKFLERLFYPSAKASNETTQMWREALEAADRLR